MLLKSIAKPTGRPIVKQSVGTSTNESNMGWFIVGLYSVFHWSDSTNDSDSGFDSGGNDYSGGDDYGGGSDSSGDGGGD